MSVYFSKSYNIILHLQRLIALLLLTSLFLPVSFSLAEETGTLTAKVILRKAADKDSKALQTLPAGDEVVLLGTSDDWYRVNYGKFTGYILKKYVQPQNKSVVANADKIERIGTAPGALHIGDSGNDVKKLQKALDILDYYDGRIDGEYGEATTAAIMKYQQDKGLEADGVAGKSTITSIFGSCAKKADIKTNTEATSSSTESTSTSSMATSSKNTVNRLGDIGSTPSPSKEGDSGTKVKKLQQALELLGYYSGEIDGDYGAQTTDAVKQFQKKRGMKQDGIAGSSTIRVLFGSAATNSGSTSSSTSTTSSKSKTETLDWFADKITSKIPKNAKFTIKDVRTGKTFTAVRWSGSNHLDAEPATAEDTKTLKSIYGGSFSWNRRAILIKYNGHIYAASMNGMPHGTTTISKNDYDGHFCIHFKNSKTHETDKVDDDHQSAVNAASKASW